MNTLTCLAIDDIAAFERLEPAWRALEGAVEDLLPFQTYVWNREWWRAFAVQGRWRRDGLCIQAFYAGERLVGIAPQFESRFGLGAWRPLRWRRPFGADPNLTEIRAPLVLPEYLDAVLDALMGGLEQAGAPAAVQIVAPEARLAAARGRHGGLRQAAQRRFPAFVLPLGDEGWEAFRATRKRNIKESLRRCYNSLAREDLRHDCLVFQRQDDILAQLPIFYRLHHSRASLLFSSVSHPDYFASQRHRRFLEAVVRGFNAGGEGRVHLFCLRLEQQPVAMRLGFRMGDSMYLYYSGYQVRFARFSVMTTLLAETLRWCLDNGLRSAHLSIGNDVSKTRWGPQEQFFSESSFVGRSALLPALGASLLRLRGDCRRGLRSLTLRLGAR